jgi:hypothetical protein
MSFKTRVLTVAAVMLLALAPVLTLPTLSAHTPTLTAPSAPAPAPFSPGRHLVPLAPLAGITIRKDAGSIAKKFSTRAGAASNDYKDGVAASGQDWQTNALAGEGNYEQGVAASIADKRYGKGISAAGAQKFVQNATTLGPQRFQTGVANAETAYARGVQPHLDAMKGLNLPPRGPKGSAQNQQRANIVATRNREIKLGK